MHDVVDCGTQHWLFPARPALTRSRSNQNHIIHFVLHSLWS